MSQPESPKSTIIPFPDFAALQAEVEKLRTELSMLVLERDELQFVECPNIETTYMLALGGLEYKVFEIECAILRLKRKAELIQAKKNRQEKIVLSDIEETLDTEFTRYQEQLNEQIGKMNVALERSKGTPLSEEETLELKKLYREIVKALHPDLHPDLEEVKIRLFLNAVDAYKNGDLEGIRIISTMLAGPLAQDDRPDALAQLVEEKERLTGLLQSVRENIQEIRSRYPYTMKSLVQDKVLVEERKEELEENVRILTETLDIYKGKIEEMLR